MSLYPRFKAAIQRHVLLAPGDGVVVGVSGGPDSLAMLHLLRRLREEWGLQLHALHVHHGIRGEDANADASFVTEICAAWDIACHIERIDAPGLAQARRYTLEEAARRGRYTALAQAAANFGAGRIAVAHNANDQAETVLLHMLRGSGLAGLRGMLPTSTLSASHLLPGEDVAPLNNLSLIRPMLGFGRDEIEAYCQEHDLYPRLDRTNADLLHTRNHLRHEIIPLLETVNPRLRESLNRMAAVLAADHDYLEAGMKSAWQQVTIESGQQWVRLNRMTWRELPLALRRAVLREAIRQIGGDEIGYVHVEAASDIAERGLTGTMTDLPSGIQVRVEHNCILVAATDAAPRPDWPLIPPDAVLDIGGPGVYLPPGSDWHFSLSAYEGKRDGAAWRALLADPWAAPLAADRLSFPLTLRSRRSGDRFRPQGAGVWQKVGDFQTDHKVPAMWRDQLPLLLAGDQIVWICGWRVDERCVVKNKTGQVWLARFERMPG